MTFSFVHTSYIHTSMFSFSKPRMHGHCNDLFFLFQSSKATATQAFFFSIPPDPAEQHVPPAFVFKLLPNPCNPLFAHENVPRMGVSPHAGFSTEQNPLRRSFVQPATLTLNPKTPKGSWSSRRGLAAFGRGFCQSSRRTRGLGGFL